MAIVLREFGLSSLIENKLIIATPLAIRYRYRSLPLTLRFDQINTPVRSSAPPIRPIDRRRDLRHQLRHHPSAKPRSSTMVSIPRPDFLAVRRNLSSRSLRYPPNFPRATHQDPPRLAHPPIPSCLTLHSRPQTSRSISKRCAGSVERRAGLAWSRPVVDERG